MSRRQTSNLAFAVGVVLTLLGGWCAVSAQEVQVSYPPVPLTASQETRLQAMLPNLRCLVCQNESLAASQAPLARDLRHKIRLMLAHGESNTQIEDYLVARYGQYVLYRPRFEPLTWLLWLGPFLLVIIGLAVALRRLRSSGREPPASAVDPEALRRLLEDKP